MEVHFAPELQAKINQLVSETGRTPDKLFELGETREMLNSRYDDLKSDKIKSIDGEAFFESLRQQEDDLLKKR